MLVQYNSERPEVVAKMLGVSPTLAAKHMKNRRHLLEIAGEFNRDCATSIGASIVPERDNYDEVVSYFKKQLPELTENILRDREEEEND